MWEVYETGDDSIFSSEVRSPTPTALANGLVRVARWLLADAPRMQKVVRRTMLFSDQLLTHSHSELFINY